MGEHSQEMTSYQCWQTSRWLSFSVFYLGVLRRNWARKSKQRRGLGDDTHLRTERGGGLFGRASVSSFFVVGLACWKERERKPPRNQRAISFTIYTYAFHERKGPTQCA